MDSLSRDESLDASVLLLNYILALSNPAPVGNNQLHEMLSVQTIALTCRYIAE